MKAYTSRRYTTPLFHRARNGLPSFSLLFFFSFHFRNFFLLLLLLLKRNSHHGADLRFLEIRKKKKSHTIYRARSAQSHHLFYARCFPITLRPCRDARERERNAHSDREETLRQWLRGLFINYHIGRTSSVPALEQRTSALCAVRNNL